MSTIQSTTETQEGGDLIAIKELVSMYARKWRWFVASLALCLGLALFYLVVKEPEYTRTASLLVKEDKSGKGLGGDMMGAFSDMGLLQPNLKVQNELIIIQSPVVITEVVRRLGLNVGYTTPAHFGLRRRTLNSSDLPMSLQLLGAPTSGGTLSLSYTEEGVQLSHFSLAGKELDHPTITATLGDTITTPIGTFIVDKKAEAPQNVSAWYDKTIDVSISRVADVAERIGKALQVKLVNDKATVIELSYKDVSRMRAEQILAAIIDVYNELWLEDKNQIAVSTSRFINERLIVIERDLGIVDGDISDFKSRNLLPNIEAVTSIALSKSKETEGALLHLHSQRSMAKYIQGYLHDVNNIDRVLPANSGIVNMQLESQISEYNELLMRRNRLQANSSKSNPLVVDLDQSLVSLRSVITASLDNVLRSLDTQIQNLENSERQNISRIASNPDQAKYLVTIERQKKIKEALYLFLLQKREENELTQAFTSYNTRIITPPSGPLLPTAPQKRNVLLLALALGLLLPAGVLYAIEALNTRVRGRKDTERILTMPYVGDIPDFRPSKDLQWLLKQISLHKENDNHVVRPLMVKAGGGDIANEAFRVVRTNLDFMLQHENKQVVMFSSINPNSGKTFIAMNLAASFALKGKRVAVLDLDIRRALLSLYIKRPKVGVSNFLNDETCTLSDIVYAHPEVSGMDIIPVGIIPPNPAELLVGERLGELFVQLKSEYDYIFVDCPPAEIVADASLINRHVDMTLFVVRVGLLERDMLHEIEHFYREDKYRHMAYVLNGTLSERSKYGYNYGYGSYMKK